jgi:hypothetical protein
MSKLMREMGEEMGEGEDVDELIDEAERELYDGEA